MQANVIKSSLNAAFAKGCERMKVHCELIFLDIDGCLSDGSMIYGHDEIIKNFNVKDGSAIIAWLKLKKEAAIISGGPLCKAISDRAKDLGIKHVFCGVEDKLSCAKELAKTLNIKLKHCAAIGDYYNDLALLNAVGRAYLPKDAAKDLSGKRLKLKGGQGCVAEMIELILADLKIDKAKLWS